MRFAAVRDVTERERNHQLLRESEARLRGLVEVAFDFFVISRGGHDPTAPRGARVGMTPSTP